MNHFTEDNAKEYMTKYLANDEQGFSELLSIKYVETVAGISETCGGCTLGDGQDCTPPTHYVDEFLAVCRKHADSTNGKNDHIRYTYLSMGWSEGGCPNSFGDYNEIHHIKYYEVEPYRRVNYPSYEELLAHSKKQAL